MRVERVLAPNPGPYTGAGTNTYVITSARDAAVLDPGPVIEEHLGAIERALQDATPRAVLVTHTHPDHAPAANVLAARLGVPALGYGPGPEFEPSRLLADGDVVEVGEVSLVAVHTPGHTADHLCYRIADVLFTGDHIKGDSTVVIEDGVAYMASLERVRGLRPVHLYPGHGPEIPDAAGAITSYIEHRLERERQIVAAVDAGAATIEEIVRVVYAGIDDALVLAAMGQVWTQLQKLDAEGRVRWRPGATDGEWTVYPAEESAE
jgi:glyoxylase-like metal-dependent hydrolase (beta-lactamase superfamily II)